MARLQVAKVLKPQGIRGELKCQVLTDILAIFSDKTSFFIDNKEVVTEKLSIRQGYLYIKFKGVDTRNDAELFRNKALFVEKDVLVDNLNDGFLIDDLIGMVLYDERGEQVGQIVDYEEYGASGIFTIVEAGHQYEVPFIQSIFKQEGNTLVVDRKEYDNTKI